jgi:hypothetical protein
MTLQPDDEAFLRRWETTDHPQNRSLDYMRDFACPECGHRACEQLDATFWQVSFTCEKCVPNASPLNLDTSKKAWLKVRDDERAAYISPETVTDILGGRTVVWRRHLRLTGSRYATSFGAVYKTLFQALRATAEEDDRLGELQLRRRTDLDDLLGFPMVRPFEFRGQESIAMGNRKLASSVGVFSLPAGEPWSCPWAGECAAYCYAKKEEQWPGVRSARERNYLQSQKESFVSDMVGWLRIHADRVRAFRPHESGDFYSQPYVEKWVKIAEQSPHVQFYTYTKSLGLKLEPLEDLPNFTVIKSYGGTLDNNARVGIDTRVDNYAKVVDDTSKVGSGEAICQATAAADVEEDKICGVTCTYCWGKTSDGKRYQVRVCFLKH